MQSVITAQALQINSNRIVRFASTPVGEKGWGWASPQAFRRKLFACLAQTGKSFSQLLPLYMETFWRVIQRWRSWEMPCARQADLRRFVEVLP